MKRPQTLALILSVMIMLTGCAGFSAFGEELSRAFKGVPATFETYDQRGMIVDQVKGRSFAVTRDSRFDSVNSDGSSNNDSRVLMISVGDNIISHVGSSACLIQDGITRVADAAILEGENVEPGTPILNTLRERYQNLWQGKAKTILIRSQDGLPIAVYAGDTVEIFATDVPQSTWFRVDAQYLWCYRVDYTVYDTDLLS